MKIPSTGWVARLFGIHVRVGMFAFLLLTAAAIAAPPNDDFANATIVSTSALTNALTGTNLDATREPGEPSTIAWPPNPPSLEGSRSVWWRFKADDVTEVTISTLGSTFDTQLGVYTGSTVSNLTEVASNEDAPDATDGHSSVTFTTVPGTTYYVMVNGYNSVYGAIKLNITGLYRVGDATRVNVNITSPQQNARTTNGTILVRGTARSNDTNDPLSQILLQAISGTNTQDVTVAASTNWQADVPLLPGQNTIRVRALTQSGAESDEAVRNVTFITFAPLTILTNGNGRVVPNLNGRNVQLGVVQRLRAVPAQNFLFNNWSGATNSTNAVLEFIMQENVELTANFIPDPWASVRGRFQGLIVDSNAPTFQNSGFFSVLVTNRTRFQGNFILGGRNYSRSGRFDENGHAEFNLGRNGNALASTLQLDLTNGTDQITGTISDGTFTSSLLGFRDVFDGRTNLPPFAGRYNLNFLQTETVQGNGYAVATIDGSGRLQMTGRLADGRAISQNTAISKEGFWPFFASLYGNRGSILGWLTFSNLPASSVSGNLTWFRPPLTNTIFPEGFTLTVPAVGSLFVPPPAGVPMLNWSNGVAELSGGGLPMVLTNQITFQSNNTIQINVQMNGLNLLVTPFGLVRGSFVHPVSRRTDNLQGAVLPKTNWAGGFFLETNQSGLLFLGPAPAPEGTALVTPPAALEGLTLNLTSTRNTGFFTNVPGNLAFTATNFVSEVPEFTGTYDFSSAPSVQANVAELNLLSADLQGRPAVVRMLLNFTSDTAGNYLAALTAGRQGTSSGTFVLSAP